MDCFNPSTASGGFTLFFGFVMFVAGVLAYRWLGRNQSEELARLEAQLKALDDKRRG